MDNYSTFMQEEFATYDNPLNEKISKLILGYLKYYKYVQIKKSVRLLDRSYKVTFSNKENIAVLTFGMNNAILIEYDGKVEVKPLIKTDFVKMERMEYLGRFRDKCLIYTTDEFSKSFYFGPKTYQGLKDEDYYNNLIPLGSMPDGVKDHSAFNALMMRIVASSDYANEIRCIRNKIDNYNGKNLGGVL